MLLCVAVCCCVWLCVAVCCCVLLSVAMCLALPRAAAEAGVLQCDAGCCNMPRCVWHCVAVCCSVTVCVAIVLGCSGVCEVAFAHVWYAIVH